MSTDRDAEPAPDIGEVYEELRRLRTDLDSFEDDVEARTVKRALLESELKRYVRWRQRKSHARGWGPYLVLLYGTVMTLGAFYYLEGLVALGAMVVLWLSTLGLYTLMVLVGFAVYVASVPVRARDRLGARGETGTANSGTAGSATAEREVETEP
jgi:membrane protein